MSKNKKPITTVVIDRVNLTKHLFIEKFAQLDSGHFLNEDGSFPEDKYCIYYRVGLDCGNFGNQYLNDFTGFGLSSSFEDIVRFFTNKTDSK